MWLVSGMAMFRDLNYVLEHLLLSASSADRMSRTGSGCLWQLLVYSLPFYQPQWKEKVFCSSGSISTKHDFQVHS